MFNTSMNMTPHILPLVQFYGVSFHPKNSQLEDRYHSDILEKLGTAQGSRWADGFGGSQGG